MSIWTAPSDCDWTSGPVCSVVGKVPLLQLQLQPRPRQLTGWSDVPVAEQVNPRVRETFC